MAPSLVLAVNGEKHEVVNPDPVATLADFLRGAGKTGVKIGCGEGGCGACTVVVAEWSAEKKTPIYRSVNACLVPLCSCDGMAVTTTEGLRPCKDGKQGFHPLQESLAAKNGSQCGFCSPGMIMSMFGKLSRTPGDVCPSAAEIETAIDGNLCRCTGYRAICEAFHAFAGTPKDSVAGEKYAPFPDFLKSAKTASGSFQGSGKEWINPTSVTEVFAAIKKAEAANSEATVSMVSGHTCRGIYKEDHLTDVYVNLQNVPDLKVVEKSKEGITFGGGVTVTLFIETLEEAVAEGGEVQGASGAFSPPTRRPELAAFPVLAEHAKRVAGHSIRNWGTIGGNIVMTKVKGFQSDLATILTGVGAKVCIVDAEGKEKTMEMDKFFLVDSVFPKHALLKSIFVPFLEAGEVFQSFKTAVRPQNSHAIVNAAFRVKMEGESITKAQLVFGAFGSRGDSPGPSEPEHKKGGVPGGPLRALNTEKAITGSAAKSETLKKALEALQAEAWWPEDDFERQLALGFLFKLFHILKGPSDNAPSLKVSQTSDRPASKGSQKVVWSEVEKAPIAESMPKLTSKLQAAGDSKYTNDIPEPKDCLYGAYVPVPRAKGVIKSYDTKKAMQMSGVVGVVTAEDIPGENAGDGLLPLFMQTKLLLPVGEPAQFAGQPFLVILADSTRHAELAAKEVKIELEAISDKPLLTVQACMDTLDVPESTEPKEGAGKPPAASVQNSVTRGDAEAALNGATKKVSGEIFCNSQKHFYMEPQVALVVPGEDESVTIWASTQVPSWSHETLRRTTGLPKNKILLNIPMVGGGFGGKIFRGMHVASVAAICAMKFKRAVRFVLNRNTDVVMTGGRVAMTVKYEAAFDETGRLSAVRTQNLGDMGGADPTAGFVTTIVNKNMEQIYGIPNLDLKVWGCSTNKTPTTAVRGPGEPQATFIMETILEHIASELGKDTQEVREVNIFTDLADREKCAADPTSPDIEKYSLQWKINEGKDAGGTPFKGYPALGIWELLKKNADYAGKAKAVQEFNVGHRWRKRGLSMTPVKYSLSTRAQQAAVCLYDDGTVLITVDGSEIGQGLHTKVTQFAAHHLSQIVPGSEVPVERIRVGPCGTDKIAHGSFTGGSTTSEGCCEAIRAAIEKLKVNLEPFKKKMEEKGDELTYVSLIKAAADVNDGAELQATGKCTDFSGLNYHVYGACVSEVEVDVLTGETTILSSSMMYDCGKSLNPLIDCGQAQGAFMFGVGFYLRENLLLDEETGKVISDGTWEYKIPCVQDAPLDFNVEFFPRAFDEGVLGSKASGEPPLVLACSVFCALRQAVMAGRKEFGKTGFVRMDAPSTPRDIALAIGVGPEDMAL